MTVFVLVALMLELAEAYVLFLLSLLVLVLTRVLKPVQAYQVPGALLSPPHCICLLWLCAVH